MYHWLALRVLQERLVPLEQQALRVQLVQLAQQVLLVQRVLPELLAQQVLLVHKALLVRAEEPSIKHMILVVLELDEMLPQIQAPLT